MGDIYEYDRYSKLIDNHGPGSNNSRETQEDDCEGWAFTMSP